MGEPRKEDGLVSLGWQLHDALQGLLDQLWSTDAVVDTELLAARKVIEAWRDLHGVE